jgi:hypothetical protein
VKLRLLALSILFAACAATAPTAQPSAPSSPSPSTLPTIDPAIGWQLIAAGDRGSDLAYSVHLAKSAHEWTELWGQLSPGLPVPPVNFETEVAAVFADGTGGPGNCSERRLDTVVIDRQAQLVYAKISDPLAPRNCDSMLGGSSMFAVALLRDALPASPFTLQFAQQRLGAGQQDQMTVDLGS